MDMHEILPRIHRVYHVSCVILCHIVSYCVYCESDWFKASQTVLVPSLSDPTRIQWCALSIDPAGEAEGNEVRNTGGGRDRTQVKA